MEKKQKKSKNKKPLFFRILYSIVKVFVKKYQFVFLEELKNDGATIIVSNHAQAGGPLAYQFYYPRKKKIWCIGEVFDKKEFPDYAMKDFWLIFLHHYRNIFSNMQILCPFIEIIDILQRQNCP